MMVRTMEAPKIEMGVSPMRIVTAVAGIPTRVATAARSTGCNRVLMLRVPSTATAMVSAPMTP